MGAQCDGIYLIGTFNNWQETAEYQLEADEKRV